MIDIPQKKTKIISFIEENGPSLPVRIAKAIDMDPVFASAILSELLNTKQIKMSHMKIGASSLYLLPEQEQKLEEQTENLKPIEKEAYLKLKERKILTHEDEEPAIRVALQNIKDFAIPFKFQEKIMWKYAFTHDEEIKNILIPKKEKVKQEKPKQEEAKIENIFQKENKEEPEKIISLPKIEIKQKTLTEKELSIETKEPKPEFLEEIKKFLKTKNIKFLEEIQSEKKEIVAKVSIESELGNINFLLIAKNKQTTSKEEIAAAIQIAIYNKMPCLLVIRKQPSKNLQKIIEENYLIKLEIID
ncbi:hypothetical protein KAI32_01505 [Candidatus Pacearchaeota archaeon]|nr:hypothetical protein [Candidatus Pacearchaeota archaeon]